MKRAIVPIALCALCLTSTAQDLPKLSSTAMVEQTVGLTKVSIEYSRPNVKGRKIFGDLVPFGRLWRTGANHCTTFELSTPAMVGGSQLLAGKYAIFTVPGEKTWQVMVNKNSDQWGSEDYNAESDIITFQVTPEKCEATESFTISFRNVKDDKAMVDLQWENTRVSFSIEADATDQAMMNIKEAISKPEADFRTYNNAASFCVDRNIKLRQALEWAQKSVEMERKYWNVRTLALAYAANGMYAEAVDSAVQSKGLAQAEGAKDAVKSNDDSISEWAKKMK